MTGAPYHLKPEDFWDRQFGDFPRGRLMTARTTPADGWQPGHWEVHRTTLPVSGGRLHAVQPRQLRGGGDAFSPGSGCGPN